MNKEDRLSQIKECSDEIMNLIREKRIGLPLALTALCEIICSMAAEASDEKNFDDLLGYLKRLHDCKRKIKPDSPTQD
jgi:hypothetical protein